MLTEALEGIIWSLIEGQNSTQMKSIVAKDANVKTNTEEKQAFTMHNSLKLKPEMLNYMILTWEVK